MNKEPLKFPVGKFTHSELSVFNNREKPEILGQLQEAIKNKVILFIEKRPNSSGRGKPSNVYSLNDGIDIPIVTATTNDVPSVITAVVPKTKVPLTYPSNQQFTISEIAQLNGRDKTQIYLQFQEDVKSGQIQCVGERKTQNGRGKPSKLYQKVLNNQEVTAGDVPQISGTEIKPALKESFVVVLNEDQKVETSLVEKEEVIISSPEVPVKKVIEQPETLEYNCPVCQKKLQSIKDATGYMVWCGQPPEICKANENPFGHANTVKAAYEVLLGRWGIDK